MISFRLVWGRPFSVEEGDRATIELNGQHSDGPVRNGRVARDIWNGLPAPMPGKREFGTLIVGIGEKRYFYSLTVLADPLW